MKAYTELAPHRNLFVEGVPMLMYHQVAPVPWKTWLPMLYVPPALFRRQLEELKQAGYVSAEPGCGDPRGGKPPLVISFDDGFSSVFENALPVLGETGFRAIQFLVPGRLGATNDWEAANVRRERLMDHGQIREWLAAGHWIGAHTLTHPRLTQLPLDKAREEIVASKKVLEDAFGVEVRHFAYPYGEWNEKIAGLVEEAGFATACTTAFGVNTATTFSFALKRVFVRYADIGWHRLKGILARRLA
jgi:peptidoglycan/xylan/chitin deacetylase (PgdA/CDA1 family)